MMNGETIDLQSTSVSSGDVVGENSVSQVTSEPVEYATVYNAVYDATTDALAASQTVTDGQAITSSAIDYFKGILSNQMIPQDYIVYVGEEYEYDYGNYGTRTAYEYCMATGDIDCEGTYFSGTGDLYILRLSGDIGVELQEDTAISLSAPLYYSRSNLGKYSGIIDRDWSGAITVIMLALGGLVWFVRKLLRISY